MSFTSFPIPTLALEDASPEQKVAIREALGVGQLIDAVIELPNSGLIQIGLADPSIFGGAIVLVRELGEDGAGSNPHGFDENSIVDRSGNIGCNAFDARTRFVGSQNYDHYNAFQHDSQHDSSGTTTNLITLASAPTVRNGTVTNRICLSIGDVTTEDGGEVVNNYGIKIDGFLAGSNRWSIYTGNAQSYFGGNVGIGTPTPTQLLEVKNGSVLVGYSDHNNVHIGGGFSNGQGGLTIQGDGTGYSEISSLQQGVDFSPLVLQKQGGNALIGTTTDSGERLQVSGKVKAATLKLTGLPTSVSGLSSGDVWNDGGTLKIVA